MRASGRARARLRSFASVYAAYAAKAERKGRTLTGYRQALAAHLTNRTDFETFFAKAARLNPLRTLIQGVVCGVRVEEIGEPTMTKILRTP